MDLPPELAAASPWAFLALIAWAELRVRPIAIRSLAWARATAKKVGVTQEEFEAERAQLAPRKLLTTTTTTKE